MGCYAGRQRAGLLLVVLLDTHVVLWHTHSVNRLSNVALDLIDEATFNRQIYVSAITFWEVAMLVRKGKYAIPGSVELWRSRALARGLQEIPIDGEIGVRSVNLEKFHNDPADRIIVATALAGYKLLTADAKILQWQGQLNRVDARI